MAAKVGFMDNCPECNSQKISRDYMRAEIICNTCGLVIDEHIIDQGPEWRAFDFDQKNKRTRTGAPMTYMIPDKGLSTFMDWKDKDGQGGDIPISKRAQIYRMRKWQRWLRISNGKERNLTIALPEIKKVSSRLNLPKDIREVAAVLYRKAVDKSLVRGRSKEGFVAAVIYIACRRCNVPRTLDEIAQATNLNRREIGRTYVFIARGLNINLNPTTPLDYVPRFRSELKLSFKVQQKANEILKSAIEFPITSGKAPMGMAASAIYIAGILVDEVVTQKDVAEVAGVTEVTVRNRYKELVKKLEIDITI